MVEGETMPSPSCMTQHRSIVFPPWEIRIDGAHNIMCHHPLRTPPVMRRHRIGWQHLMPIECLPRFVLFRNTSKGTFPTHTIDTVCSQDVRVYWLRLMKYRDKYNQLPKRSICYCFCWLSSFILQLICNGNNSNTVSIELVIPPAWIRL